MGQVGQVILVPIMAEGRNLLSLAVGIVVDDDHEE